MTAQRVVLRPPAVAGTFYPADAAALRSELRRCLAAAAPPAGSGVPKAIVVPHAGYIHSGPVAATAYLRLEPARSTIRRVVLLGPSHHVPLRGMALSSADAWGSPLGIVPLDIDSTGSIAGLGPIGVNDLAHSREHSLEVQIPFLQTVLDDFALVPIVVGAASEAEVAAVIDAVWEEPGTVVVVSTDLSHYHPYQQARLIDEATAAAITGMEPERISNDDACGARALRGMLLAARRHGMTIEQLDLRNSGDTSGDRRRVVGYGAFAVA